MPDADSALKLQTKRLFWRLGLYPRIEVDLSAVQFADVFRRQPLTDIDVLGVAVSPALQVQYVLADCKTSQSDPVIGRLFWLKGVMDYFQAREGMVVHKRVNEAARELSTKLRIGLFDENDLNTVVNRYAPSGAEPTNMFDADLLARLKAEAGRLPDELRQIYLYVRFRYWLYDPNRNLLNLMALLRRHKDRLNPTVEIHRYLVYELIALYSMSLLHLCSYVVSREASALDKTARFWMYGGPAAVTERMNQIDLVNSLMGAGKGQPALAAPMKLDPDYWSALLEVVNRLLERPTDAASILRYSEIVLYEVALGSTSDIGPYFGAQFSLVTLKLLKDIANFYAKAGGLDAAFLEPLNSL